MVRHLAFGEKKQTEKVEEQPDELDLVRFINDIREQVVCYHKKKQAELGKKKAEQTSRPRGGSLTPNEADPTVGIYG